MGMLEYGGFDVFKDLLPSMINCAAFSEYIEEMTFQSSMMLTF